MIPQLSDAAIDRIGALLVHADHLVDAIYFTSRLSSPSVDKAIRDVRDDLSDHNLLALKLALDREGRLPK